jgi:hypothetical protein
LGRGFMKRPVGVIILGILGIIGAVIDILAALTIMGVGSLGTIAGAGAIGAAAVIFGVFYLIIGVLLLVFAISFLGLKSWAWWGMVFIMVINIVWGVVAMAVNGFETSSLIGIIINVLIVVYLYSKNVKEAFFGSQSS